MARRATNKLLQKAKKLKSDEFYTQLSEIESELKHYKNQFKKILPHLFKIRDSVSEIWRTRFSFKLVTRKFSMSK